MLAYNRFCILIVNHAHILSPTDFTHFTQTHFMFVWWTPLEERVLYGTDRQCTVLMRQVDTLLCPVVSLILETKIVLSPCRFLMTSTLTSDNQPRCTSHTSNTRQVIFTLGVWHTQGHWGEGNEFLLNRGVSVICSGEFCLLLLCLSSGRSQVEGRKKKNY